MTSSFCILIYLALFVMAVTCSDMPLPFYREIKFSVPELTGSDVLIASTLLSRQDGVSSNFIPSSNFTIAAAEATKVFQSANGLTVTGEIDSITAQALLDILGDDNYTDSGFTAESLGYLYKFHLPFYKNRSIESVGTLFDKENNVLLKFPIRGHGHRDNDVGSLPWPDFGDGDVGLNQFTKNGNTVTGLVEIDFNSAEPYAPEYGPWPINRLVRGLDGNALLLLPNLRDGILIHTGNWTTDEVDWNPTMDMPNSSGCIHTHPSFQYEIYQQLLKLGVVVNDNPFSGKNYPYKPQGIAVIEQID